MGIMSRRVLPVCGRLCICCPELRARSRQPVKRYKRLLSDIFPKSQEELPNDRKIGKLTEYASKNPLRIPKIAASLEQRGYRALRNARYSPLRIIMRAYSKLLSSCRDQMPLFGTSVLAMIRVLLDHRQNDAIQVLACLTLIDFLNNQMDSTYMRDLDVLLPKLCGLSREKGEEQSCFHLRAAGLQALASVINFLGKYSHIPPHFDIAVEVVLENYESALPSQEVEPKVRSESHNNWVNEMFRGESHGPVALMRGAVAKLHPHKDNSNLTRVETATAVIWPRVCIQNMARLAKEATTVRRVLDPMLRYFDTEKHWPPEKLAIKALSDFQHFMEKSGNEQLSLAALVRHLDQNGVVDNPELKTSIVEVIVHLARKSTVKAPVAIVGAMNDLLRHLRKSMEFCVEASKRAKSEILNLHEGLQHALEECLIELVKRVGDAAPIFDMMATNLEKLSANPTTARTTTEAVFVLAHCVAYIPDQSSAGQIFPQALFQQLLQGMVHPDVETRVTLHHIFSLLLVPSSLISKPEDLRTTQSWSETSSVLSRSRSSSAFSSAAALFEKLGREKYGFVDRNMCFDISRDQNTKDNGDAIEMVEIGAARNEYAGINYSSSPSPCHGSNLSEEQSWEVSMDKSVAQFRRPCNSTKVLEQSVVRLSGHQAALLLSKLWIQAILPDNLPSSYEAIANTYILTLLFSRAKTSSHKTVIRAFQLALSLRSLAIDPNYAGDQLPPSRRRSLFTLSTAMLVFAGRAYGVPQLGAVVKASLTNATKDPYLELADDIRLKIVNSAFGYVNVKDYGSTADDRDAYKSFLGISMAEDQTSEALAALIVGSSTVLGPDDFAVADQMLQAFHAENGDRLGSQSYFENLCSSESPLEFRDTVSYHEDVHHTSSSLEDNLIIDTAGVELPPPFATYCLPPLTAQAVSVSELLESTMVTTGHGVSPSTTDIALPYTAVANQCKVFSVESRRKISSLLQVGGQYGTLVLTFPEKDFWSNSDVLKQLQHDSCRQVGPLPPASPFDNFLKAAGRRSTD